MNPWLVLLVALLASCQWLTTAVQECSDCKPEASALDSLLQVQAGLSHWGAPSSRCHTSGGGLVVFSLTTIASRIEHIRPTIEALLTGQTREPDAVYLAVGPAVGALPEWLEAYRAADGSVLRVLRQEHDPGPGLKLIGAAAEEMAAGRGDTLIVYGDDDVVYGKELVKLHADHHFGRCNTSGHREWALGARRITAGSPGIPVLEATGGISLRARAVPRAAFRIGEAPDACRFSDDFFLAYWFEKNGLELDLLEECEMNWDTGQMSPLCIREKLSRVEQIEPLSRMLVDPKGKKVRGSHGFGGDWRTQLERYKVCQRMLDGRESKL